MADLTVGMEEELQLVDRASSQLRGGANEVVARIEDGTDPASKGDGTVEHELQLNQVEIATPVCSKLADVRAELVRWRRRVIEAAEAACCRPARIRTAVGANRRSRPSRRTTPSSTTTRS